MKNLPEQTQDIFAPGGLLSELLDGFEPRPGQLEMAVAVARILSGGKLVVEAETGIGKTLAYLIPAILSGQKIVISTNTLNLQEQILSNDIPFIQKNIAPDLSALCVKGRQNYLCIYRWQQFAAHPQHEMFAPEETRKKIEEWLRNTNTGDRAELPWLEDDSPLWREISSNASQCLGSKCPDDNQCFITKLRKKAGRAMLLIVNHHLFFSDLALRREGHGEILPRYETVIFDEAHHLENVATSFFGFSFSYFQLLDLVKDINLAALMVPEDRRERVVQATAALQNRAEHFAAIFPERTGKFPLQDFIDVRPDWEEQIEAITERLSSLASALSVLNAEGDTWQGLANRCIELQTRLIAITGVFESFPAEKYIRWYERREKTVMLSATPIDIAAELSTVLYPEVRSAVFTSGTLTVGGDFTYFCSRLGLDQDTDTLSLASPFDYANRTLLYVPAHTPENQFPQPDMKEFPDKIQYIIKKILLASKGRGLVLFTSFSSMRKTYPYLVSDLPYPVFVQGEAPRHKLLESFRQQTNSVLFAVASFWEGINVPGESLSCVIIDKLPFEVPSDPVIMARLDRIREEGGNPFMDFQLPRAILALRQGVGRLMRTSTDKGLLAILDIRLFSKRYGKLFLKSLPPSPLTRNLEDIDVFFKD
ncbi:ATP-dependent DNA helicase [Thermodesulfobacteriota bacterium]